MWIRIWAGLVVVMIMPSRTSAQCMQMVFTGTLRAGESYSHAGYGSTVQDRLAGPVAVQFVLTEAEFQRLSIMADETLDSPRPEAVGEFIKQVSKVRQGRATLEALKYGKGATAETAKR